VKVRLIHCIFLLFAEFVNSGLGRIQETVRGVDPRKSRLWRSKSDQFFFHFKSFLHFTWSCLDNGFLNREIMRLVSCISLIFYKPTVEYSSAAARSFHKQSQTIEMITPSVFSPTGFYRPVTPRCWHAVVWPVARHDIVVWSFLGHVISQRSSVMMLSNCFVQSQLAEEIEKLRSELDQFRLRAGSLTEPTLSR